jgi:DNA adenine methylase
MQSMDYYSCRCRFNEITEMTVEQASLFYILNKRCFNGLYRVNKKGLYNVPEGKNKINWDNHYERLLEFSQLLNENSIHIEALSYIDFFEKYKKQFKKGDVIYVDPPYWDTFVSYDGYGFSQQDQENLYNLLKNLKCHVIASNSNTDFIKELYGGGGAAFQIEEVEAFRFINSKSDQRNKAPVEVIITKN